jgi:hypothetical protein
MGSKMKLGSIILFTILFLPLALAADIDINLSKYSYSSGETAWGQISVNVNLSSDLKTNSLNLVNVENIPMTKVLFKVTDKIYFFYFEVPKMNNGNYKLVLSNISYVKSGIINKNNFETNIIINNVNQTIYVWPAVLFSEFQEMEDPIFKPEIKNIGWNKRRIVVTSSDEYLVNSIVPFDFNLNGQSLAWVTVRTNITDYNKGFQTAVININTDGGEHYNYPVILKKKWYKGDFQWDSNKQIEIENTTNIEINVSNMTVNNQTYIYPNDSLKFINPLYESINQTVKFNGQKIGVDWTLKNFAEHQLNNLSYNLTGNLDEIIDIKFMSNSSILKSGEELNINVALYPNLSTKQLYVGELVIYSLESVNDSIEFEIHFINDTVENGTLQNFTEFTFTNKSINNKTVNATLIDYKETKSNTMAWIIVLVVIAIIGIVALMFYKKSKPKREKFDEYLKALEK